MAGGKKNNGIMTAQLVANIDQFFVPYEFVAEAHVQDQSPQNLNMLRMY